MKFVKAKDQLPPEKKPVYCKNKEYRFILYHEDDCWRDWEDSKIYVMDDDEHNEIEWLDESLPSKEEGWISVDDGLPPKFKNVLCLSSKGQIRIACVDNTGKMDDFELEADSDNYTHWHFLPQPPNS